MSTTISIPEDLADELYERKSRGESYADVIRRLIEQADHAESGVSDDERDSQADPDPAQAPTPDPTRPSEHDDVGADSFADLVDDVADDVLPGSGAKLEARREAFRAVVDHLREHRIATPSDFREAVYPDHQAQYTDGKDPAHSWWKNAMYPALKELADRTDEIERPDQAGEWRWRGDV
jgi:hypothetical protein